jgi:hypothetical protein
MTAMAALRVDPPDADPPAQVCTRCSKPITPGTASQVAGRAVHLRCLVREAELKSIAQQDRAGREVRRAQAAQARAAELIDKVRRWQTTCSACGQPLATSRGVLFQDDQLVHAACWRSDPPPFATGAPLAQ